VKKRTVAKESTREAAMMTNKTITNMMTTGTKLIQIKLQVVFGRSIQMKKMNGIKKESLTRISTEMTNHKMKVTKMTPVTM
jgi:hypothetical protein